MRSPSAPTTISLQPWREPLAEPLPAPPHPADREALALKAARERVIIPLARAARAFIRARGWTRYGYARLSDVGMEVLDHSSRSLTDLASLGWALERLPRLRSALTGEDGGRPLGQVAATLVGRVAGRDSLPAWIALARSVPVRELREQVALARQRRSMWPPGAEAAANDTMPPSPPPSTFSSGVPANPPPSAPSTFSSGVPANPPPSAPSTSSSSVPEDLPASAPSPSPRRTPGSTDYLVADLTPIPAPATNEVTSASGLHPPSPDPTVEEAADLTLADDLVERGTYRLPVPALLRAAFDEALELHRAVEGSHAPIASFVEALLAEAIADGCDPDDAVVPVHPRFTRKSREARVRRWAPTLNDAVPTQAGFSPRAREVLARLATLEAEAGTGKATEVLHQIKELLRLEDDLNVALGEALLHLAESREFPALGFLDVGHYAEERLGISRSAAERRTRLARAGRRFPQLARYHRAGWIKSQGALLVAQVLGPRPVDAAHEREWVEAAMGRTLKRLRDDVRLAAAWRCGRSTPPSTFSSGVPGDFSTSPTPSPQRKLGSRTTLDAIVALDSGLRRNDREGRDRPAHLCHPIPPPPTDAEWHASLRREPGLARERVRALALQALSSGPANDTLRLTLPLDLARDLASVIAARRASCGQDAPAWHGLLALLLDFVETWDDPRATPRRPGDQIYERDGYRCAAPGCTSRRHLEVHHIVYRSHGGADDVTNEVTLCRFHHARGEHGGLAQVTGTAPLGLLWRLGGAADGAWFRNERRERAQVE